MILNSVFRELIYWKLTKARFFGTVGSLKRSAVILTMLLVPLGVKAQNASASVGEPNRQNAPAVTADADFPVVELFGGYSYLPEMDSFIEGFADPGHGWGASFDWNLQKYFGVFLDVDRHIWTLHERRITNTGFVLGPGPLIGNGIYIGDQDMALYYFSAGPRAVVRSNRFAVFGLAAFEFQRGHSSESTFADASNRTVVPGGSSRAYGFGLGGGTDVSFTKHLALRAFQINYSLASFGEGPGRKLRIKTGIVFKF